MSGKYNYSGLSELRYLEVFGRSWNSQGKSRTKTGNFYKYIRVLKDHLMAILEGFCVIRINSCIEPQL